MDKKRVYTFGNGKAEGKADMKNLFSSLRNILRFASRKEKSLSKTLNLYYGQKKSLYLW
mgnify:CR=1 FL=1